MDFKYNLPETVKMNVYLVAEKTLILRLTNIADKFDQSSSDAIIDINEIAENLYVQANNEISKLSQVIILEMSLTAN